MKDKLIIQEDKWSRTVFRIEGDILIIENTMYEPYEDELFEGARSTYSVPLKKLKEWLDSQTNTEKEEK